MRQHILWDVIFIFLIAFFLFTRFYKLPTSFFYFNDMGRDSLALLDWAQTGKPPLLGPQTSALPFNQGAVYYYLLYPLFRLMQHSPFSAILTSAIVYVVTFSALFYFLRNKPTQVRALFVSIFFITIIPQYIIQQRFVWNPSLATPFLLISFFSFLALREKFSLLKVGIFALAIALATTMSYSVLTVLFAYIVYSAVVFRKKLKEFGIILISLVTAILFVNLPTLLFEVRHHFLLTHMLLTVPRMSQTGLSPWAKLAKISEYSFSLTNNNFNILAGVIFFLLIAAAVFFALRKRNIAEKYRDFTTASLLFLLTLIFALLVPVGIQMHYTFGLLTLGIICIAFLPLPLIFLLSIAGAVLWFPFLLSGQYFARAPRTVAEMQSCFRQICAEHREPLFVTVQASFHPYHTGWEHRFLMREAGCDVVAIETDPNAAQTMALIGDDAQYEPGKTTFSELTTFGPAQQTQLYTCTNKFRVYILKKKALR